MICLGRRLAIARAPLNDETARGDYHDESGMTRTEEINVGMLSVLSALCLGLSVEVTVTTSLGTSPTH